MGEGVEVKHVDELTRKDLGGLRPEWRDEQKMKGYEWVVLDEGLLYDVFRTREDAEKEARLLKRVKQILREIEELVMEKLDSLSRKELRFLREYVGDKIEIKIPLIIDLGGEESETRVRQFIYAFELPSNLACPKCGSVKVDLKRGGDEKGRRVIYSAECKACGNKASGEGVFGWAMVMDCICGDE